MLKVHFDLQNMKFILELVQNPIVAPVLKGQLILTQGKQSPIEYPFKTQRFWDCVTLGSGTAAKSRPRSKVLEMAKLPSDGTGKYLKSWWRNPQIATSSRTCF